jgi:3-oxoadipate enol-lactonase
MAFATVDGGQVYYESVGEGRCVVLAHAGLLDTRMWDREFAALAAAGYRAVRYDARGHGRSSSLSGDHALYDDVRHLLGALSVDRASLVGVSLGARTAVDCALAYPDLVEALVLVGPGLSGMAITDPYILAEQQAMADAAQRKDRAAFVESFLRQWVDGPHRAPGDVDPEVRELCRTMAHDTLTAHAGGGGQLRELVATERLEELRVPVFAILGELDSVDIAGVVDGLATRVPGARRLDVPDAGHMVNLEAPDAFDRALLGFLRGR